MGSATGYRATSALRSAMRGSASSTSRPAISRSRTRMSDSISSSTASSTATKRSSGELEQSGHRLRTRSDSEIALHLYEDLGTECLHRLRGEFAFVIWDESNRTLFAARDRFGIKPLFYAFHQRYALSRLGSESAVRRRRAGALGCRVGVPLVEFGGHQIRTLFDGVFQVPPGHYLIATDKHIQLHQYWDFDYPRAERNCAAALRRRLRGGISPRARGSGAPAPARGRSGRLLSQRRTRLVRRAGSCGAASSRSHPRVHADLRPRRLR